MKSCKAAAVMIDPRLATSFLPKALVAVEEDQSYRVPVTSRALETPIQAHPRHGLSRDRRRLHGRSRDSGARGVKEPLAKEEREASGLWAPVSNLFVVPDRGFAGTWGRPNHPPLGAAFIVQPLLVLLVPGTHGTLDTHAKAEVKPHVTDNGMMQGASEN